MKTSLHRGLMLVALLAGMALAAGGARADDGADARNFVVDLTDKAIVLVGNKDISDQARVAKFRALFVASFDMPEIGQFVLGRHWSKATAEQQQQFLTLFEDFTVLTWSRRFKEYSGVSVEVEGVAPADKGDELVDTMIKRPQGDPIPLQWKVHHTSEGWRIIDIIVQGVSMGLTQRQDFASAIQSNGGNIQGLLQTLSAKVDQLKSGA